MLREIFQHSKQLEIFQFLPIISYFYHNGHSGSYPILAYPVKIRSFTVFAHIFSKFFRRSRATFLGLAGHFRPAGHRLGTTALAGNGSGETDG